MPTDTDIITPLSAMRSIVEWSVSQQIPTWQRDALRRLYTRPLLSSDDESNLFAILLEQHSLLEDGVSAPDCVPLCLDDVPNADRASAAVTIRSMDGIKNVNALAEDQKIVFHESGVTVIFGNNGSGKSGYARILKSACRTRSNAPILHNVYDSRPSDPASARLTFSTAGVEQPVFVWRAGSPSAPALTQISVFDSHSASIHVDEKNEAAYIPVALQILKELSDLCRRFKSKVQAISSALSSNISNNLRDLKCHKETEAGRYLHGLTSTSSLEKAQQLARVSAEELSRIRDLKQQLQSDSQQGIALFQARKKRVEAIEQRCVRLWNALNDDALPSYREAIENSHSASEAARLAANSAFTDDPLTGIGSETWKALWEAARRYSDSQAYPNSTFPNVENAACLLCQQPLSGEAGSRLSKFEAFVKQNAQKAAETAQLTLGRLKCVLQELSETLRQCNEDVSLVRDELVDLQLASVLLRFYRTAAVRRGRLLRLEPGAEWIEPRPYSDTLIDSLRATTIKIQEHVEQLRQSIDATHRASMLVELNELEDRVYLNSVLDDVATDIQRRGRLVRTEQAIAETDTTRITRKTTELADSLITDAWRDRFASEISKLEIHHLRIELQRDSGSYGSAKFRVALIRDRDIKLGTVLSEGEYRCIALAAFLSELATVDNKSALVFDDPVSSLDHEHRESLAKRLAEEAVNGRQLIIFTHDVFFLDLISRNLKTCGASAKYLTVNRLPDNSRSGAVDDGIPSDIAPAEDLADGIRRQVKQLEGLYNSGRMVQWSGHTNSFSIQLRKCWERAVAEVLSPVVERFNAQVNTKNVWQIAALDDSDFVQMRQAYKRCSELNHEKCAELKRKDPAPQEYYSEIDAVTTWIQTVRTKQQAAQDNRPSL